LGVSVYKLSALCKYATQFKNFFRHRSATLREYPRKYLKFKDVVFKRMWYGISKIVSISMFKCLQKIKCQLIWVYQPQKFCTSADTPRNNIGSTMNKQKTSFESFCLITRILRNTSLLLYVGIVVLCIGCKSNDCYIIGIWSHRPFALDWTGKQLLIER